MTPKAVNGNILIAKCENPANKNVAGIDIQTKDLAGMTYGVVVAIDETVGLKHICKVGDIIYAPKAHIVGEIEIDGTEVLCMFRESMIGCVVSDVVAKREYFGTKNLPPIIVPSKKLQIVQ